jgi:hypothetical protein
LSTANGAIVDFVRAKLLAEEDGEFPLFQLAFRPHIFHQPLLLKIPNHLDLQNCLESLLLAEEAVVAALTVFECQLSLMLMGEEVLGVEEEAGVEED